MAKDLIRYDILAQDALRGVVRKVLGEVAKTGLPGEHHFFISFATTAAGVRISSRLLAQYEKEMTIVLQNQFRDLKVDDNGFEVSLSFDGVSEFLAIPFSALKGFFDPSVQFGLQFDVRQDAVELAADNETATDGPKTSAIGGPSVPGATEKKANANSSDPEETPEGEKVVSLDSFRKKP